MTRQFSALKDDALFEAVERVIARSGDTDCPLLPVLPVSWHLTSFAQYLHHLIEHHEYAALAKYQNYFVWYRAFLTPHLQVLITKRHLFTHIDDLSWVCRHFPDIYDSSGFSILFNAYMYGLSEEDTDRLINHGALVHLKNQDDGMTAFMYACHHGDLKIVKFYIDRGVNVNMQDNMGWTAALYAATSKDPNKSQVLKMLQDAGADFTIKNEFGQTVADYLAAADL